jgi:Kef-type K+ transport system membrane component KefB
MEPFSFLPTWPPEAIAPLAWIAVVLLAAIVAGESLRRFLRASRVFGYLAVGALVGPSGAGLIDGATINQLRIFVDIAVGMLLFELGQRVDLGWLRRNPSMLAASVLEALLTAVLVYVSMTWFGIGPVAAAAAALLAVATSPAVVMTVIKDLRGQGQVSERVMLFTALNTAYAVIGLTLMVGLLHDEEQRSLATLVLHPLYLVGGSLLLAGALAMLMLNLLRLFGRRPSFQFSATVSLVLLTVAAATMLRLSVPLALLLLGVFGRLFDRERHFVSLEFGETAMLLVVLLFALAGASLEFSGWAAALPLAVAFVGARLLGKAAPILLLSNASGLALRKSALVGLGLTPMSGLALLMLHELMQRSPSLAAEIGSAMFLAIGVLAFAGPLALEFALRRAGEVAAEMR